MKIKNIITVLFIIPFLASHLVAGSNDSTYEEIISNGKKIELNGRLIVINSQWVFEYDYEDVDNQIFFEFSEPDIEILKAKQKELLAQDELIIKGYSYNKKTAVTSFVYKDNTIKLTSGHEIDRRNYDLFIDYDGDGICDYRKKNFRMINVKHHGFKSYKSFFCNSKSEKLESSHGSHSGGSGSGSGGGHGGGHGGGGG